MVVNKENKNNGGRVKFISYDGENPNLCHGVLVLEIDGVQYKFGHHYQYGHYNTETKSYEFIDEDPKNPNYNTFWLSGGECYFENDYKDAVVKDGEWIINADEIDEKFRDLADEIDKVFNENVPWGCCGGCL